MTSTSFDLRATKEYRELGFQIVKCPVCGKETLNDHFICPTCGWEYDGITEENDFSSCNKTTVADYRKQNL
jgi:rRNA maturation protein Nop10